jgi:hypothetical protein
LIWRKSDVRSRNLTRLHQPRLGLRQRVAALSAAIDHLASYRPDDLGSLVAKPGGGWIELAFLPAVLLTMLDEAGKRANRAYTRSSAY